MTGNLLQAWLEEHGPVHALVDGANVALFGQNWEHGAFSFGQIKGVMDQLQRKHPDLHPLMASRFYLHAHFGLFGLFY